MTNEALTHLDVVVIGGGPAGISTCLALSKSVKLNTALFETEVELGGMPRSCHIGFGMRDQGRFYSGPAYAQKLRKLIRKTDVKIHTESTVLNIIPNRSGGTHGLNVITKQGLKFYESRFIVLATGCCESSRGARFIPGTRPAGIYTTGALQQMVNFHHLKPGKRALIIGSEDVALSSVLTLNRSGTTIVGMVEEDPELHTYPFGARIMSLFYGFPIYKDTSVKAILGNKRVEGVELIKKGSENSFQIKCDTVIITGRFSPVSTLIDNTVIEQDPLNRGPLVDMNLMTSVPGIFAAGNLLRGADMNDLCALEGRHAAKSILKMLASSKSDQPATDNCIIFKAESPIRYVVPQKIMPTRIHAPQGGWLCPGVSIQLEHTIRRPVIEAWSGNDRIWQSSFSKIYANTRTPLALKEFEWERVGTQREIVLKLMDS